MALRLGIGVAAGPDPALLAPVAGQVEELGFDSAWCNDNPAGDGLAQLEAWGRASARIVLGVGVLALDRHSPDDIALRAKRLGTDLGRVRLGVGPGFSPKPLETSRQGVGALRGLVPGARIVLAAMGPRMCRLAGELADGVLLNWTTPERAAYSRDLVHEGARAAGRSPGEVTVYGYVRTAIGKDAHERLAREASMYAQMPHYARHFEAMGADPATIGVATEDARQAAALLARWDALDVVVVRALATRTPEAVLDIARAAAGT